MTTGSLLPEIINAVIAVAPMNTVCQGFGKEKGITFLLKSTWSFHGKDLPYTPFLTEKFPLNNVLLKSLQMRELSMYDLYEPLVLHPNSDAVIRVENATGPILLISSKMDTMWLSELVAKQIMNRLKENNFTYQYRHLSYNYGSHLFVVVRNFSRVNVEKTRKTGGKPELIRLQKHWNLFLNGKISK